MENLNWDLSKEKEGKRGKEQEQRSEDQISEDRWGDTERRTYIGIDIRDIPEGRQEYREQRSFIGISQKRETGRQEKTRSRDPSNGSLMTYGETDSGEPT